MTTRGKRRTAGFGAAIIALLGFSAAISAPGIADAAVFIGFGFGLPIGFPFYYPPYPYPPPPPYYPAPVSYPAPQASTYPPPTPYPPAERATTPSITYTPRSGWTNAQGEYCREYKTTQGTGRRATERFGTACRDRGGQWRIVN